MPRILTTRSNKILKREYRLRFFVALLVTTLCALTLFGVALIPSYVLLDSYEAAYTSANFAKEHEEVERLNKEYSSKLAVTHELSQKVSIAKSGHMSVLDTVFLYGGEGIRLNSIEVSGTAPITVSIRGEAATRSALLALDERFGRDRRFTGFDLPIDTLTKQTQIPFNVTFTYNEN